MSRLSRFAVTVVVVLAFGTTAVNAAIIWSFNYSDTSGVGFNSSSEGAARRQAVDEAAAVVSCFFSAYSATIVMDVSGAETDNDTLASAGSNSNASLIAGFGNRGDVGLKILGQTAPNPTAADGTVNWNFEDFT